MGALEPSLHRESTDLLIRTYILYSECSYVTLLSLLNKHLLPLIEVHLTLNWQLTEIHLTVNCQDGQTALMTAALNGHSNVVETLLQHGASVDVQDVVSALSHVTTYVPRPTRASVDMTMTVSA